MKTVEVNFDGLVGPTHNYSGLSYGNLASLHSKKTSSSPKKAALQGLEKMRFLADLGIKQAVLPPHERPHFPTLKELGFKGSEAQILSSASKEAEDIFYSCCSAASMWTANAATISPSADTQDHKLHITPANLSSKFHRSIEAAFSEKLFRLIFNQPDLFQVHAPLPPGTYFSDEGAANHSRFCENHSQAGIEFFVWGKKAFSSSAAPLRFPARQTFEASQAIARRHLLDPQKVIFAQQNPLAIDAGVFHNDVISVTNENVFFYHECAFENSSKILSALKSQLPYLIFLPVPQEKISLEEAVKSYLFNSQIVTLPDQSMHLIAPSECFESENVRNFLHEMLTQTYHPIKKLHFLDLHQSMANGGGPACLRLRIALTQLQLSSMHQGILWSEELYQKLKQWIETHYRETLEPQDLADIQLWQENQEALDELTQILKLGPIYSFQK
ncbi:MAG: N-succinylarginine dihydrolase [Chlamydiales bacterium 38-26]|nr:N-succinylarginine dihydrolase [Chlamydiales bacterium]OJV08616.1 MAG: N-succinylarginine dihydrolase [Chlamydiales bacterium 38-26]